MSKLYDKIKADRAEELARSREQFGIPSNKGFLLKIAEMAIRTILPMDGNSNARTVKTNTPF